VAPEPVSAEQVDVPTEGGTGSPATDDKS
jgi:hypothetical protein